MATTRLVPLKPALLIEGEKRHLVVTDTHIGFEAKFAHNKIFVGKNTILNEMLEDIFSLIESYRPDDIILLGDVKSGIEQITKNEWNDVPKFLQELQEKTDVIIIPGNHDANIQKLIPDRKHSFDTWTCDAIRKRFVCRQNNNRPCAPRVL
jgi:uncharacterized protein